MGADGARKLFVGGLADSATEADLRAVFEGAGFVVEHLALPRDRESGRLRGFAFITLSSDGEAQRARSELQGKNCCGRPLSIREFSQEPPKRGAPTSTERAPRQEEPTVFLGKLPFEATQEEIQQLFAAQGVGPVVRVTLPMGPDGRARGFGFATLPNQDQVDLAVKKVNGATLRGRPIVVSPAQPRSAGGPGGGGRDGAPRGPRSFGRPSGGPPGENYGGDFGFESVPVEPPPFPPTDGKGGRRRHEGGKHEGGKHEGGKKEKRGSRRSGSTEGVAAGPERGNKRRRGGGANWHQWEDDD